MTSYVLYLDDKIVSRESLSHYREVLDPDIYAFLSNWFDDRETLPIQTSGSTGIPKEISVRKTAMIASARLTIKMLNLSQRHRMLLCMSARYIAGKMMIVRAMVGGMHLYSLPPTSNPFRDTSLPHIHFVALTPMQVSTILSDPNSTEILKSIDKLLIGGGPVHRDLSEKLRNFPHEVWSSYGMTETLSHIALRRMNGTKCSESYTPIPQVNLRSNDCGQLIIEAPFILSEPILTNDIVEFLPDGSFCIIGRTDNVINSGGIKIQIEEVEKALSESLHIPFIVTSRPHSLLGEEVIILIRVEQKDRVQDIIASRRLLPNYHRPRKVLFVEELPLTETGKPARQKARELASKDLEMIDLI